MGIAILFVDSDEVVFALGIEKAKLMVRALSVPDRRVRIAAAQVIVACADQVTAAIEEIARLEEDLQARDRPEPPCP